MKYAILSLMLFLSIYLYGQKSSFHQLYPRPHCQQIQYFSDWNENIIVVNQNNQAFILDNENLEFNPFDWPFEDLNWQVSEINYVSDTSFFVKANGSCLYSNDNGETFIVLPVIDGIGGGSFITDSIGYTVSNDKVYKTIDGGFSYSPVHTLTEFDEMIVLSLNEVYVLGDSLHYTMNGGESWETKWIPEISNTRAFEINSLGHIFLSSNNILYRSTDNGNTYSETEMEEVPPIFAPLSDVQCNNDSICYANSSNYLYMSNDYGETWNSITFKDLYTNFFVNPVIQDDNNLVISDLQGMNAIYQYNYFNEKWTLLSSKDFGYISGLQYDKQDSIYYLASIDEGSNTKIFQSTDFGYNWEEYTTISNSGTYNPEWRFDFSVFEGSVLYYVNIIDRNLLKSNDGGESFEIIKSGKEEDTSMQGKFPSKDTIYMLGFPNSVNFSLNGGETWEEVEYNDSIFFYIVDIFCFSDDPSIVFVLVYDSNFNNRLYLMENFEFTHYWDVEEVISTDPEPFLYRDKLIVDIWDDDGYKKVLEFSSDTKEVSERCIPTNEFYTPDNLVHIFNEDSLLYMSNKALILTDSECSYTEFLPLNECQYISPITQFNLHDAGEGIAITSTRIISYTKNFDPNLLTGIERFHKKEQPNIYLFPNPTSGFLQLNTSLKKPTILLYTIDGKLLGTYYENSFVLPADLQGLYFYTILDDGKYLTTGKVIVQY